jgi:hypothetical protein
MFGFTYILKKWNFSYDYAILNLAYDTYKANRKIQLVALLWNIFESVEYSLNIPEYSKKRPMNKKDCTIDLFKM